MKVDIGVIGALGEEVSSLISELLDYKCEKISGIEFHLGRLSGKAVAIAKCGVGKVFAAICAEAMIINYSPSLIINSGVGGALAGGLSAGDIVIADKLCQHDMDTSALGDPKGLISGINMIYFDSDKKAVEILKEASKKLSCKALVGTVASGDKFIADASDKRFITENFSAAACEMEGGAIAQAAFVNNTPFVVIRAISDSADGEANMSYAEFLPIAAERSSSLTRSLIELYRS